jgi:hypothetical protein
MLGFSDPAIVATSVASRSRIDSARVRLDARGAAEELIVVGASLDAENELTRGLAIATKKEAPCQQIPKPRESNFSVPGEGHECVAIARRVMARVRTGVPFDRMAVLPRSPEDYRANLEEAFATLHKAHKHPAMQAATGHCRRGASF